MADIQNPASSPSHVTDAELSVLRLLWRLGEGTIRQLADTLYPDGGVSAHATVQKLLQRLEGKGCVARRRAGRAHVYFAEVSQGQLIRRRLQDVADTFYEGALSPLMTHLVGGRRFSSDEVEQLRDLVDRLQTDDGSSSEDGGESAP